MWKIRSLTNTDNHGKPQYWSKEFGWTWENMADGYTEAQREAQMLPKGAVWELMSSSDSSSSE